MRAGMYRRSRRSRACRGWEVKAQTGATLIRYYSTPSGWNLCEPCADPNQIKALKSGRPSRLTVETTSDAEAGAHDKRCSLCMGPIDGSASGIQD